jgi:hypothetical protein
MSKRVKRGLLIGCLALVLLPIAGLILAFLFLGSIIKQGVEQVGPKVTGTTMTVQSVSIRPLSRGVLVKGLRVGNPEGYKTEKAFEMGEMRVEVDPFSLLGEKIVVRKVHIIAPDITYEKKLSGSNLDQINENVNKFVESISGPAETQESAPAEASTQKLQIDELVLEDAKVNLSAGILKGKSVPIPILDIRMQNLGTGPEGITIGEAVKETMKAVLSSVGQAIKKAGSAVVEGISEPAGEVKDKVKEGTGKAVDKVKGLFNK